MIKLENITIDSKSGYSGAGKNFEKNLNIKIYLTSTLLIILKITDIYEIDQEFKKIYKKKNFIYF